VRGGLGPRWARGKRGVRKVGGSCVAWITAQPVAARRLEHALRSGMLPSGAA